jgi:hypothetical protein
MIDSVVRGRLLQFLYERRDQGAIAFGHAKDAASPPQGINRGDWLGAVAQLAEYGLIDWEPVGDRTGRGLLEGFASISESGMKVMETGFEPPISIAFGDDRRPVAAKPQPEATAAVAAEQLSVTEAVEKVIAAIEQASVSEHEKKEAKSCLRKLLAGRAAANVLGAGAHSLLAKYFKD